jgi:acyl-CoA thioesterase-2
MWFSTIQDLPSNSLLHQQVLAWVSDIPMLGAALQPSGIPPVSPKIKMTSLDHTIWFYDDFSVNDWMLMHCHSPASGAGKGLTLAEIYKRDGTLVACCSQEGMLRLRK